MGRLGEAWGGLGKWKSLRRWDFLGFLRNVVSVQQLSDSMRLTKAIQVPKPRLSETTTRRMHEFKQASVHPAIAMPIR